MTTHVPVLVGGGGISGLVCGYALRRAGVHALVVEAAPQAGGLIRSERCNGYLLELGPQSFSGTGPIRELCGELGIAEQLVEAPARAPRYLLVHGQLRAVPLSPPAFFASSLFSAKTKWSLVRDIFGHTTPPEPDESMADFTRRRFSAELLDKLVGPFVSGIYAGDAEKLSLRGAFPAVYEAEREAGSVIRGMIRAAREKRRTASENGKAPAKRQRPTLQTFRDGNETLVKALAGKLGAALRTGTSVAAIQRVGTAAHASARFEVTLKTADAEEQITADNLLIATATDVTAHLLREVSGDTAAALASVEYAPVALVSLGYAKSAVGDALDGFGFLIPRSAGLRTLGTVWNSSLFAGRAPQGHVLLTSFVGGATDPEAAALGESELSQLVHGELTPVLKLQEAPEFAKVTTYKRALPQYNLGHAARVAGVEKALTAMPGLFLTGNYLHGPAIGACVEQGLAVAERIAASLRA
jgi:oxygen-dependent protoporphyrinogen oxidase